MISAIIILHESRQNQKANRRHMLSTSTYIVTHIKHKPRVFCHFAIHTTTNKDNTFTTNIQIKHLFCRTIPNQDGKKATKSTA